MQILAVDSHVGNFGSNLFNANKNANVVIEYILSVKRFEEPLFQWSQEFFNQGYESINSVSTVIVTYFLLFVDFCSYFLRNFYLFRGTLIVLGTG